MRLQHVSVAIPPDGAERARAFYGGLLGLDERDVLPTLDPAHFIWFRAGGDCELHLMLMEEQPPEQPHFCLAVEDGLDELRARLEAGGVETRDGTALAGRPRFTCRDPFGNLIELTRLEGT
jgi:catechol 2,3-dioxygenase-like lactoylglutathione lyase family enzyme